MSFPEIIIDDPHAQVEQFHETYGMPVLSLPGFPAESRIVLRLDLIDEERSELDDALNGNDIVEVADALGDMVYVIFGAALEFGIDLREVINEIHKSNMSKLGADGKPIYREDGKVLKGPNFVEPDLKKVLGL